MAVLNVTLTKIIAFEGAVEYTAPAAITAEADGAEFDCEGIPADKILLIIENADAENAEDVTIKKGEMLQATADLVISVPASKTYVVQIEGGKYLTLDGKLVISGTTDLKIAAVAMH
ncbi:MAG: hypothetical protein AAGU14_02660 [Eubacteriaceae bacterium]